MKLHIENFAKIANADIEINGITVIAGENNTGKSTVSKVLYSIFDTFFELEKKLSSMKIAALRRRLERYLDFQEQLEPYSLDLRKSSVIAREIVEKTIELFNADTTIETYTELLNDLIAEQNVTVHDIDDYAKYSYGILSTKKIDEITKFLFNNLMAELNTVSSFYTDEDTNVDLQIQNEHINFSTITSKKSFRINNYIPLNKEVVYYDDPNVIDSINYSYLYSNNLRRMHLSHNAKLSIMLRDTVQNTNMYEEMAKKRNLFKLQEELKEIVDGDFVEEKEEFKFKSRDSEKSFSLNSLSSGLKGMAVLLRLIESGKLEDNTTIILDEPEIHLHPKWQLKYAEMLVKLQKTLNLHILVNSHSPYFISAIETYSAKYEIANKCKYYLSDLNEENMAVFEDVTRNTDKIYKKLAEPLKELEKIIYGNR